MVEIPSFFRLPSAAGPGADTVTKSELIERVAEAAKLTKGKAELVVGTIFGAMTEAMVRGEGIEIRGFGSFTVRQYKAYEGRNPRTGGQVHVRPKRLPFFKVGKELRARVNLSTAPLLDDDDDDVDSPSPKAAAPKPAAAPAATPAAAAKPRPAPKVREENLSEDEI
jgi:integration host factor subunit beta